MKYVTYENRRHPHITIHKEGCNQIAKRGGTGEGEYHYHDTLQDARNYAEITRLPVWECSFCNP